MSQLHSAAVLLSLVVILFAQAAYTTSTAAVASSGHVRNVFSEEDKLEMAKKYFAPLMMDKRFNSIHDSSEFSTSQFYLEPLIHPFENERELAREVKRDPFGFQPNYNANFMYTRMLQSEFEKTRSPSLTRTMNSIFGEGKRLTRNIETSLPESEGGHSISLDYDVTFVRGLVALEAERESVSDIECVGADSQIDGKYQKMRLHVQDGHMETVSRWIPGSRFILTPELNCFANREKPAYFLMIRRHKISESIVEYDLTPIMEQDCYMASKIDFRMTPNEDIIQKHMDMATNFKDSTVLGSHISSIPAYHSIWRSSEKQTKSRYAIDTTKSLDLLNFNYNRNTGKATNVVDFYKTNNLVVQCTNCFAFVGFDFRFRMDTTFVWINVLEATVEGNAKFAFETLINFGYQYKNTWEKTIFTSNLSSIRFTVGPIPVLIDPVVSLKGRFEVEAKAVLKVTHVASFTDRMKIGIKYENKQFTRVNERKGPTFVIQAPKISDDSQAEINAMLTLIPTLTLKFYSITPLDLSFLPYIRFNGKIGNTSCGRAGASYNTYWGLNMMIQLQKLKIPSNIYGIGGKEFDLGGNLPFPKSSSAATFSVVSDRAISCTYCSGCLSLTKLWNSRNVMESVSSFLEASAMKRDVDIGSEEPTVVPLGKSIYSSVAPESGKCHVYQTTSLDSALPANALFKRGEEDSRESVISLEIYSTTGAILPSFKLYFADNIADVRDKSVAPVDVLTTKLIQRPWQNIYLAICNDNEDVPSSMRYSFQSKPSAEISQFNIKAPSVTVKKDHIVQIRFKEGRNPLQAIDNVLITKNTVSGRADSTVHFYALDVESLIRMDSKYLVSEAANSYSESALQSNPQYSHTTNDYLVTVDVLGNGEDDVDSVCVLGAQSFARATLRTPLTIPSTTHLVEVKRGDSPADEIWRYVVKLESTTTRPTSICFFTQQRGIENAQKQCHTVGSEEYFTYQVPAEAVELGYDFFMVELVGAHEQVTITCDEHVYIKSGRKSFFQLRPSSKKGDRFIFYRDESVSAINADKVVVSGRTYSKLDRLCLEDCEVSVKIQLADVGANGNIVTKWESATIHSDFEGVVHIPIDFNEIKATLPQEDADNILTFRIIIDIANEHEGVTKWFELWADEVAHASESRKQFSDRVTMSSAGEIMYYQIPRQLVTSLGGAAIARVKSFNPSKPDESTLETGVPHLYLQKGSLPRHSAYMRAAYEESSQTKIPMIIDESSDYYLGVATQSQSMDYTLEITTLAASTVDVTYEIDGKPVTSLSTDMLSKHGMTIIFTLNSDDQEWTTSFTDPTSDALRKLIASFSSNAYKSEFAVIQEHMLNTWNKAFDPSSAVDPKTFIVYDRKVIKLIFPPFNLNGVVFGSDMVVSVDKNLDKSFFNSEDFRITVDKGAQFTVEKNSSNMFYYVAGACAAIIFLSILLLTGAFVAFVVYKLIVQSRNRQMKGLSTRPKEELLNDMDEAFFVVEDA